ncbi:MAG: signal peptidase I [Puniceicoccales bacterium]|jgi:signal peptidase I|nr:signal peptidase I [Puniceicoccales bacterium]
MLEWLQTQWQNRKKRIAARNLLLHARRVLNYRRGQLFVDQEKTLSAHVEVLKKNWRNLPTACVEEIHEHLIAVGGDVYPVRRWTDTIEAFLMAIIVAVGFRAFFAQTFTIPTNSMLPSYYGMTAKLDGDRSQGFLGNLIRGITYYAPKTQKGGRVLIPLNGRAEAARDHSLIAFERMGKRSAFLIPRQIRRYRLLVNDEPVYIDVPAEFDLESTLMERFCPKISSKRIADAIDKFPLVRRNGRVFLDTGVDVAPNSPVIAFDLQHGDVLFVERLSRHFRQPKRGDAVVFATWQVPALRNDDRYYIKRLVGVPGDVLSIRNGKLLRDGNPANDSPAMGKNNAKQEPYGGYFPYGALNGKNVTVPDGHFYVMGDNSANSYDSRFFGPIPQVSVAGRPLWVFFPRRGGNSFQ